MNKQEWIATINHYLTNVESASEAREMAAYAAGQHLTSDDCEAVMTGNGTVNGLTENYVAMCEALEHLFDASDIQYWPGTDGLRFTTPSDKPKIEDYKD